MTDEALFYIFSSYTSITFKSSAIVNSASVAALISSIVTSGEISCNSSPLSVTFITPISVIIISTKDKGTFNLSFRMSLHRELLL